MYFYFIALVFMYIFVLNICPLFHILTHQQTSCSLSTQPTKPLFCSAKKCEMEHFLITSCILRGCLSGILGTPTTPSRCSTRRGGTTSGARGPSTTWSRYASIQTTRCWVCTYPKTYPPHPSLMIKSHKRGNLYFF